MYTIGLKYLIVYIYSTSTVIQNHVHLITYNLKIVTYLIRYNKICRYYFVQKYWKIYCIFLIILWIIQTTAILYSYILCRTKHKIIEIRPFYHWLTTLDSDENKAMRNVITRTNLREGLLVSTGLPNNFHITTSTTTWTTRFIHLFE